MRRKSTQEIPYLCLAMARVVKRLWSLKEQLLSVTARSLSNTCTDGAYWYAAVTLYDSLVRIVVRSSVLAEYLPSLVAQD